jgi:hypothetical protein
MTSLRMVRATERRNDPTALPDALVGALSSLGAGAGANDILDSWVAGTVVGVSSRAEETFRFASSVMV